MLDIKGTERMFYLKKARYIAVLLAVLLTGCKKVSTDASDTVVDTSATTRKHTNVIVSEVETVNTTVATTGVTAPETTAYISSLETTLEEIPQEEKITGIVDTGERVSFIDEAIAKCLENKEIFGNKSRVIIEDMNQDGVPELLLQDVSESVRQYDGLDFYLVEAYDFKTMSVMTTFENAMYGGLFVFNYPTESHVGLNIGDLYKAYINDEWITVGTLKWVVDDIYEYYIGTDTSTAVEYDTWQIAVNEYLDFSCVDLSYDAIVGTESLTRDSDDKLVSSVIKEAIINWSIARDKVLSADYFNE